jgi:hypothetical protein
VPKRPVEKVSEFKHPVFVSIPPHQTAYTDYPPRFFQDDRPTPESVLGIAAKLLFQTLDFFLLAPRAVPGVHRFIVADDLPSRRQIVEGHFAQYQSFGFKYGFHFLRNTLIR